MPIVYKGLFGKTPPAGSTPVDLTDDNLGPLLRVWLLIVTNPAFWATGSLTPAQINDFAATVGVDPITFSSVIAFVKADANRLADIQAATQHFQDLVHIAATYPAGNCPHSPGTIAGA